MYRQRTISKPISMVGTKVFLQFPWQKRDSKIEFKPAKENSGIVFNYKGKKFPATLENTYTPLKFRSSFASCIGLKNGSTSIIKIEHILAHLYAMGIDNLDIFLEHSSVPRFDNGGKEFFDNLESLVVKQDAKRELWKVNSSLSIKERDVNKPDKINFVKSTQGETSISYFASFPHKAVGEQRVQIDFNDVDEYKKKLCRQEEFFMPFTKFVGDNNAEKFRQYLFNQNIHGISHENSLLVGGRNTQNLLNSNGLGRKEFVKHKIQDGLAQLALAQKRIVQGKIDYHMTSHQFDMNAWRAAIEEKIFERVN